MSRALLTLVNDAVRQRAHDWVRIAPQGTRVQFSAPKRSTDQNARMWSMLTEIARQKEHCGRKYDTGRWKLLFMHALGQETEFMPALDGSTFIPCNGRSSELSVKEMSELIELMFKWGAENGVVFHGETEAA